MLKMHIGFLVGTELKEPCPSCQYGFPIGTNAAMINIGSMKWPFSGEKLCGFEQGCIVKVAGFGLKITISQSGQHSRQ